LVQGVVQGVVYCCYCCCCNTEIFLLRFRYKLHKTSHPSLCTTQFTCSGSPPRLDFVTGEQLPVALPGDMFACIKGNNSNCCVRQIKVLVRQCTEKKNKLDSEYRYELRHCDDIKQSLCGFNGKIHVYLFSLIIVQNRGNHYREEGLEMHVIWSTLTLIFSTNY